MNNSDLSSKADDLTVGTDRRVGPLKHQLYKE
jgi:hypothetical protein